VYRADKRFGKKFSAGFARLTKEYMRDDRGEAGEDERD
jgi:hypothetical protein